MIQLIAAIVQLKLMLNEWSDLTDYRPLCGAASVIFARIIDKAAAYLGCVLNAPIGFFNFETLGSP